MNIISRSLRVFILIFTIVLVGCTSESVEQTNLSPSEISNQIGQEVRFDKMKEGDQVKLQKLYDIQADEVESYVLYTALSNVSANEFAIIKTKNSKQAAEIESKFTRRVEEQKLKFQDYRPEQYFLVTKHVIKTKGPYTLFAVSEHAEQIENVFDRLLK